MKTGTHTQVPMTIIKYMVHYNLLLLFLFDDYFLSVSDIDACL